jgi:hypothetical protein
MTIFFIVCAGLEMLYVYDFIQWAFTTCLKCKIKDVH